MRVSELYSSALLCAVAVAAADDTADKAAAASSSLKASTTSVVELPTFTPSTVKAPFFEQFTSDWTSRWKASHAKKEDSAATEEWAYVGEWAVEEPTVFKGIDGDKGLVLKNPAAHHAISAKFPKKIDPKGKTLVVQYEVKLQNGLECGGAYMKLLQDNKKLHAEEFSNASPYVIMFGPDKCGSTNKVHFIFRHKNPKSGEYEEKHYKEAPNARITKTSVLYTLIVKPDNDFEIQINGDNVASGNLLEDFAPSVNPEKEIDDPKDKKPEDWVDEAQIPDPEATKPEDWDEDAPFEIPDEDATKPDDWLEDVPATIPDPEAEKPEDWDDEEDGDWMPPSVPNPKCEEVSGCGPWERPTKKNPDYKGVWSAPYVDNPEYKGEWEPKKIANPNFFEDKTPAKFEPIGGIGFEIWTMQSDILFDNIYIGHSISDAIKIKNETFDIKLKVEKAAELATRPADPDLPLADPLVDKPFLEDPITYIRDKVDIFYRIAMEDPKEAVKEMPEVAGGIGVLVVTVIVLLVGLFSSSSASSAAAAVKDIKPPAEVKNAAAKVQETAGDVKDSIVEAASSGAEKVSAEVNKRTTRSSGPAE